MAKIKTRDAVKGTIKTIDKAAVASERTIHTDGHLQSGKGMVSGRNTVLRRSGIYTGENTVID